MEKVWFMALMKKELWPQYTVMIYSPNGKDMDL